MVGSHITFINGTFDLCTEKSYLLLNDISEGQKCTEGTELNNKQKQYWTQELLTS